KQMKKRLLTALALVLVVIAKAQWLQQNANLINDTLGFYEMSLPDQHTAWAVCYDGKAGLLSTRPILAFTRTTDGGNNWTPGQMGNDRTLRFSNISAIDGKEAWVAMHKIGPVPNNYYGSVAKGGGVFHTTDGGVTWQHTDPGELFNNNSVPRFVHFKDKNHGVAMGDPNGGYFEIYTTNNKGKKWKRVRQENIPAPLANEVGWISGHAVVGNTIWFGTDSGRMYKSVDFGKTWTVNRLDSLLGAYVHEIAFLDDGLTGVAHLRTATRTFVFSTTDGGLTWTNYFQPANWKNSRMTAVPGTNAFVSTAVHPNPAFRGSAVSYDAGQTWTQIENAANKAVCRFFDANTGYAGGFFVTGPPLRGGIFKSQIVFQTPLPEKQRSIVKPAIQTENTITDALVKIYPTPANNVLNITLPDALANTVSVVSLVSTDGKTIETRRTQASRLIHLDVSKLLPGMYIVRIQSNKQTISKAITISR
ncbi:MAG TPA: T9SS type A sorting domain-containing protein, partial [Flavisolibacter sp.]|nr:T9SS type A sorting domain-containing protein [Flavisolibacter sp.]